MLDWTTCPEGLKVLKAIVMWYRPSLCIVSESQSMNQPVSLNVMVKWLDNCVPWIHMTHSVLKEIELFATPDFDRRQ